MHDTPPELPAALAARIENLRRTWKALPAGEDAEGVAIHLSLLVADLKRIRRDGAAAERWDGDFDPGAISGVPTTSQHLRVIHVPAEHPPHLVAHSGDES